MKIKPNLKVGGLILFLFFLFPVYAYLETYWYDVNRVVIADPGIPPGFEGKTIVFISDMHYGGYFDAGRVRRVVDLVNSLEPDYIILGGDYVSGEDGWDHASVEPLFDELRRLNPVPRYAVLGNHDHWFDSVAVERGLRGAGVALIDNECVNLSCGLRLCGAGDLWTDVQRVSVGAENYTVLVSHNPEYAEELNGSGVDFVLSGHMHGGQVTFFGLWAPYLPSRYGQKYRSGFVDNGFNLVYVTRGVGQGLLVRFFARPEVTVITLKGE